MEPQKFLPLTQTIDRNLFYWDVRMSRRWRFSVAPSREAVEFRKGSQKYWLASAPTAKWPKKSHKTNWRITICSCNYFQSNIYRSIDVKRLNVIAGNDNWSSGTFKLRNPIEFRHLSPEGEWYLQHLMPVPENDLMAVLLLFPSSTILESKWWFWIGD